MRSALLFGVVGVVGVASAAGACTSNNSMSGDDTGMVNCATQTNLDTYTVDLEKMGDMGMIDVKLHAADPSPPASGDNTWTLQINSLSSGVVGAPMDGLTITTTPYMPAHMHYSPKHAVATDKGGGTYEIAPVYLWMPGTWETTFEVATPAGTDSVMYRFCLPD